MLIREQGRLVTLLRAQRNPATNRIQKRVIGKFRAGEPPPATLLEQLEVDERHALDQWLGARRDAQARERGLTVLQRAPAQLDELVAAIDVAADVLNVEEADRIWRKLQAIARGLRQAGHPKPRPAPRPPAPLPGQLDLVEALQDDNSASL
ncbi:hypothetical protein WS97_00745 [Burkholderia territorii]|uniref:hypothetical protein n=1 Tax=Burkholderia territorii TaxID=1503055 RepID=UPI0007551729|nr:hypothetical protein [Burkholderia territorii]KVL25485.1 hypothetical protein WS97_00745 [Burkholderia territorii]KWO55215.1 hypothetical protein WT98_08880 [Burkholderia territorii]